MLPNIFRSATVRLTVSYLVILMSLSIIFSTGIYLVASNELQNRVNIFQTNIEETLEPSHLPKLDAIIHASDKLRISSMLIADLIYINLVIFVGGGFISYLLARRTLVPIRKLHEAQSQFTSDASHELRTPLAVMKTELEVALRDKNATTDELKEVLSSNLEEVDKISKLAEMLLNLSRLDNTKLKFSAVNLDKLTSGVIGDFKQAKGRIKFISKKQQIIYGNETAIVDLVRVLIDNSIKYSPKDSEILIKISKQEDALAKFEITNKGPGIKSNKIPHIFDRFYRVDTSRTSGAEKGYGLGLALAKNITELHGGEISVKSTPNKETTFTFVLPLNSNVKK